MVWLFSFFPISKDLDNLYEQQVKALQDPVSFVEKLQNKVILYSKKMILAFEDDLCQYVA